MNLNDYDFKKIAIYAIIGAIIGFIVECMFYATHSVAYSFIIAMAIVGIIIGFMAKDLDTGGIAGGVAGVILSIIHVIPAKIFMGLNIYPLDSVIAFVVIGAIFGAGTSLILTINK